MALLVLAGVVNRNTPILQDKDLLGAWLYQLAELIEMHPVSLSTEGYEHWPAGAPSATLYIEESAITVHCYPETRFMEIVMHSCKAIPDPLGIARKIQAELQMDVRFYLYEPALDWRALSLKAHPSAAIVQEV